MSPRVIFLLRHLSLTALRRTDHDRGEKEKMDESRQSERDKDKQRAGLLLPLQCQLHHQLVKNADTLLTSLSFLPLSM